MTEFAPPLRAKLDWSKMLGFDQAARSETGQSGLRLTDPRLAKLGGKVGNKPGLRFAR